MCKDMDDLKTKSAQGFASSPLALQGSFDFIETEP